MYRKKQNNKEKSRLHEAYREKRRKGEEGWGGGGLISVTRNHSTQGRTKV